MTHTNPPDAVQITALDGPKHDRQTHQDGDYGWVIVFSSFLALFIGDGIVFSFGLLLVVLIEEFGESTALVATLGGLFLGCTALSATLSGSLTDVFGHRYVTIFGASLYSLGLFVSMFATDFRLLYLSYGIIGGFGFGFIVPPLLASVMEHFTKRRALAGGLTLCGSGFGGFVMNLLTIRLLETYKWQGTFLILSGIQLNGIACGLTIPQKRRKIKSDAIQNKAPKDSVETQLVFRVIQRVKNTFYITVWKNNIVIFRKFRCFCILLSTFCFGLGCFVPFTHLPKQAEALGMDRNEAAWLVSSFGITNTLGRIGIGWLGSRSFANRKIMSACIFLLDAVSFPVSLVLTSFNTKLIYALVYGAVYGGNIVLLPVMLADSVSAEYVDKTSGLFVAMHLSGGLAGLPLAGWTVDMTDDFNVCYILAGTETLFAAILLMLPTIRDFCSRIALANRTTHF